MSLVSTDEAPKNWFEYRILRYMPNRRRDEWVNIGVLLEEIYGQIPPEWYDCDADALERMLEQLLRRRKLVRELIVSAWKSSAQPFPNWK